MKLRICSGDLREKVSLLAFTFAECSVKQNMERLTEKE